MLMIMSIFNDKVYRNNNTSNDLCRVMRTLVLVPSITITLCRVGNQCFAIKFG